MFHRKSWVAALTFVAFIAATTTAEARQGEVDLDDPYAVARAVAVNQGKAADVRSTVERYSAIQAFATAGGASIGVFLFESAVPPLLFATVIALGASTLGTMAVGLPIERMYARRADRYRQTLVNLVGEDEARRRIELAREALESERAAETLGINVPRRSDTRATAGGVQGPSSGAGTRR